MCCTLHNCVENTRVKRKKVICCTYMSVYKIHEAKGKKLFVVHKSVENTQDATKKSVCCTQVCKKYTMQKEMQRKYTGKK